MKFINQLNLPRTSDADIAKNVKTYSIKQVENILQPTKPRAYTPNLCEYLQGDDYVVKLYFDSDQYYEDEPDDEECRRVFEAFKENVKIFMQGQEGFDIDKVKFASRHGLTLKKDTPYKISFRAYGIEWTTPYSRMKNLIEIRGLQGDSDGKFDTKVYTPNEQLINCVFACKGGPKVKYDSRVLLPFGDPGSLSDYTIQYLRGDEKPLDFTKFVKKEEPIVNPPASAIVLPIVDVKYTTTKLIEKKIIDMLNMLKQERWDDRASWINIAIILKRHGGGDMYYPIWLKLSQTSRKFSSEIEVRAEWDSLSLDFDKKPIGIGSLNRWAREDDPTTFHRVIANDKNHRWLRGDLGLSEMAVELCSDVIKFDPDQKLWFHFDSSICKWRLVTDSTAKKTIGDSLRSCLYTIRAEISSQASQAENPEERNRSEGLLTEIAKYIKQVQSNRGLQNILAVGIDMFSHKNFSQKLDTRKNLIGVKNGVIDLRTGHLRDAVPEDMICRDLNVEYDESADTTFIHNFIRDIMADDEEMVDYIQKLLGYAITGEINEEVFVFLTSSGRNGKSMLINSIEELMRDTGFFIQGNTGLIVDRRVSNIDAERAKLNGSRIVVFNELKPGDTLSLDDFKTLSGGDPIVAAAKYGAPFSILPSHLPICITNHMPKLPIVDIATAERCIVIEFPVTFVEIAQGDAPSKFRRSRDNDLKRKISDRKVELLRFLVDGAMEWYAHGALKRDAPDKVKKFTKQYLNDQDDIDKFIEAKLIVGEKLREPSLNVLAAYNAMFDKQISSEDLAAKLATKGFRKKYAKILGTSKSAMCYIGFKLQQQDLVEHDE